MKRKTTELEQRLIDNGFELKCKHYEGRHSEKICSYEYIGVVFGITTRVLLDRHRTCILTFSIYQPYGELLDEQVIYELSGHIKTIKKFLDNISGCYIDDNEVIEVVESVENE